MDDKEQRAVVIGPTIIASVAGVSLQDDRDVTDCTQLALWTANQKFDRFSEPDDWFTQYAAALKFLGWVPYKDSTFHRTYDDFSGSVIQAYLKKMTGRDDNPLNRALNNTLIDTFDAIEPDKPALLSLDQESLNGQQFQIAPVQYDARGQLTMLVSQFSLLSSIKVQEFLFQKWDRKSASLFEQVGAFILDRSKLETNRAFLDKRISEIRMTRFRLKMRSSRE